MPLLFGRIIEQDARLILLDELTKGVDFGAKSDIYDIIYELAEQGRCVAVVSSEEQELLETADRIVVFRHGVCDGHSIPASQLTIADLRREAVRMRTIGPSFSLESGRNNSNHERARHSYPSSWLRRLRACSAFLPTAPDGCVKKKLSQEYPRPTRVTSTSASSNAAVAKELPVATIAPRSHSGAR
jgi:ABC-type multidrug transport system ATPase subunit